MIFVAGSTGFGPIKGIIEHAIQEGVERPIFFYWGVRAKDGLYLNALPEVWQQRDNFTYVPVLSASKGGDQWQGRTGLVHEVLLSDFDSLAGYEVYASGSPAMIEAVRQGVAMKGLAGKYFYFDSFEFANETKQ